MGTGETRARASGTVGEILVAAVIFAVAMSVTWVTHGRDGPLAGILLAGASADEVDDEAEDAGDTVVSYGPDGELIHETSTTTAPADLDDGPGTGSTVTVPSSTTTVPGAPEAVTTAPPTSGPGTSTSTSAPATSSTTVEPTTTTSTTEPTTTTSTTEPTTTTTAPEDPPG
ncbi:MAG TPA: hypothetical protein VIL48_06200 [Acidimicrobiales bacterium]